MTHVRLVVITTALLSLILTAGCASPGADDAYREEIESWHQGRLERLTSDTGYLTLVGLYLLENGTHTFGSADDNDMVFPDKAPAHCGVFIVGDTTVSVRVNAGVVITTGGTPVTEAALAVQTIDTEPTVLEMGTLDVYAIERGAARYIRVRDPESAWRKNFAGVDRYPVDPKWRITGRFEPYDPPRTIMVPDVLAAPRETQCPGAIVFEVDGKTHRLEPFSRTSKGDFFVVFGDETSGEETYGGGRFVYCGPEEPDGTIVVDFNKAYNPPCAFTPHTTCPLPTEANMLSLRVEAGEKTYDAH